MNNIKTPEELLEFMSDNIQYGYLGKKKIIYHYDDPDFNHDWYEQYILENSNDLLNSLYGTCWDQVEFERDWFLKNGYEIKTIFEIVQLDYDNDYPTHTFLIYKDNDYWCWFEHSDFNNRGIHKYNSLDELLNDQHKKYVDFLKTFNIKDEEIDKIIITEYKQPKEHLSAEAYLNYVINSKIIN